MSHKDSELENTKLFGEDDPTKKFSNVNDQDTLVGVSVGVSANAIPTPSATVIPNNFVTDKYIGTTFQSRYKIIKELGRGGIGIVYLAEDLQLMGKPVVVKVLIDDNGDEWLKSKFRHEIEALARINHPNVVSVLDTGKTIDNKPFLVMQFIEGGNLRTAIKPKGMELERVANIIQQLGAALRATHDKGIFHRDLKPENIMLQKSGQEEIVRLIDFGIAKVFNSKEAESTKAQMLIGTFTYMSPEQLSGNKITVASDIFALGIIAYELLTGAKPFVVEEVENLGVLVFQLILKREQSNFAKPREIRPEIPLEAEKALLKALSPKEQDRYQQADEFSNELVKALRLKNTGNNSGVIMAIPPTAVYPLKEANTPDNTTSQKKLPQSQSFSKMLIISSVILVVSVLVLPKIFKEQPNTNIAVIKTPNINSNNTASDKANTNTSFKNQISYYLILQRYRDNKPFKTPIRLEKEIIFQPYDRVKIFLTSQKTGHLYIFNESPLNQNTNSKESNWNWNILFPIVNNNVSKISANEELQIPDKQEFFFDKESGIEKLWLIWSENTIDELENLTKWNNKKAKGAIQDKNDVDVLEKFISQNSKNKPLVEKDEENKKNTTIKSNEKIVVYRLDLRHE